MKSFEIYVVFDSLGVKIDLLFHLKKLVVHGVGLLSCFICLVWSGFLFKSDLYFLSRFSSQGIIYLFIYLIHLRIYLFIYGSTRSLLPCTGFLQLQQVGITLGGSSLVVECRLHTPLWWLLLLQSMDCRASLVLTHRLSCPVESSQTRNWTCVPYIDGRFLTIGPQGKSHKVQFRRIEG